MNSGLCFRLLWVGGTLLLKHLGLPRWERATFLAASIYRSLLTPSGEPKLNGCVRTSKPRNHDAPAEIRELPTFRLVAFRHSKIFRSYPVFFRSLRPLHSMLANVQT